MREQNRVERNEKKQKELIKEEHREQRNKIIKKVLKWTTIILVLIFSFLLYARFVATEFLVVREYPIESSTLPQEFHGFKVIQFSDLHYGSTIDLDDVKELTNKINTLKPDLIVFTGDLIDKNYTVSIEDQTKLIEVLKTMSSTTGKYAVSGNHDEDADLFRTILEESGFKILDNTYDLIYYKGYTPILITGVSSSLLGEMNIDQAFSYLKQEQAIQNLYTVTLLHEPDNIDNILTNYHVDLALAGHSHNGQIRLPGIGSIITVQGAKKYDEEFYQIGSTSLYISGGIGTSTYKYRLFNHPSINFFRLRHTS